MFANSDDPRGREEQPREHQQEVDGASDDVHEHAGKEQYVLVRRHAKKKKKKKKKTDVARGANRYSVAASSAAVAASGVKRGVVAAILVASRWRAGGRDVLSTSWLPRALRCRSRRRSGVRWRRARAPRPPGTPLMAATGAVAAPARAASVLWRFSRPGTAIGTAVSVAGLFALAVGALGNVDAGSAAFQLVPDAGRGPVREHHRRHQSDHRR